MIPRLTATPPAPIYAEFLAELQARGFQGDLTLSYADRTVLATDNSIYQLSPQAVAFPSGIDDLVRIARVACEARFVKVKLSPRGGGTGTNGQSLTDGLMVDLSRHMNRILEINVDERWVRVEAGVVKDQLNAALAAHGLFFPPELSTSNRATIGGMVNTDASGQGSCLYGKTRDHVLELSTVFIDGTLWRSGPLADAALAKVKKRPDLVGAIHRLVDGIHHDNSELIERHFPPLNRCLTGYDLAHIRDRQGRFNLNSILCGSEGTLGMIAEAKLNVVPIPRCRAIINVRYASFDAALRDARALMDFGAASIETIDSWVLSLAQKDLVWQDVRAFFPDHGEPAKGINLVEFVDDSDTAIAATIERVTDTLGSQGMRDGRRGYTVAVKAEDNERIWEMRKKAVGLLGNMQGDRRPVPFVEDTAVPPEHLADYIAEFRAALDRRGLLYGMFGHVDAGVLHVRPAIDMKDPAQEKLVREITEEVVGITRKYHGLLWGEHGKGVRSEFSPQFFGPLYPALKAIKAAFDAHNQLNPGKIATPDEGGLLTIDGVPTRGQFDRSIPEAVRSAFDEALHCNGNGACYNYDFNDPMCPSWKATRERRHSPKGRASLLREWLRQMSAQGIDCVAEARRSRERSAWISWPARLRNSLFDGSSSDFSHMVKEAMDGCLACKSCVGQCPIKVDVPRFRAKFLELYYGRYLRPVRDHLLASVELLAPRLVRISGFYNALVGSAAGAAVLGQIGIAQAPKLSEVRLARVLRARGVPEARAQAIGAMPATDRDRSVVIVQDVFTSCYEATPVLDFVDVVIEAGFNPLMAPLLPNGKPLHVHGFLGRFSRLAAGNAAMLQKLSSAGVDLVGLDPSMTLTYRTEYAEVLGKSELPSVLLPQEWLTKHLGDLPKATSKDEYLLLPHCSERTTAAAAVRQWQEVFTACGLSLKVLAAGCCGMAGAYGHVKEKRETSERIYAQSWARHVADFGTSGRLLATGYSCRSQVRIIDGLPLPHPLQALLAGMRQYQREDPRRGTRSGIPTGQTTTS
jgi:FAD/FMN-containing dehydrogenase/Fe-S oxidoreductase